MAGEDRRVRPLAPDFATVCASPDPDRVFCYSPGLAALPGGRLVATTDWGGPGVTELEGPKYRRGDREWQGRIYTSDDGGRNWRLRGTLPFQHARPFVAGGTLYVLGHAGDLTIICSEDDGETWSEPCRLTDGQRWHQAPCNVHYAHGRVYLVMERRVSGECPGWNICENAPVLMRAREEADLTRPESWTFASEVAFCDAVADRDLEWFGVPFYPGYYPQPVEVAPGRSFAPIGWLESNVVRFTDPDHIWHDPEGKTVHLWMRAHTGVTNMACIARVTETGDAPGTGAMETQFVHAPSGKTVLFVPCPGGQMKFHVLHDEVTGLYWLLSTQATDSLTRPDRLPPDRYNLPYNQRRRLALHFSGNMWDWCFAGLVDLGGDEAASRHYASMVAEGEDLLILSRSGDERARNAHDVNMITFHRIRDFRRLVY